MIEYSSVYQKTFVVAGRSIVNFVTLPDMKIKLLLVDDEPTILESGKMILENEGYDVLTATDGLKAIEIIKNNILHIIITDYRMPKLNGLGLINWIKNNKPDLPVFMITSYINLGMEKDIRKAGACEFMLKPIDYTELIEKIESTLNKTD